MLHACTLKQKKNPKATRHELCYHAKLHNKLHPFVKTNSVLSQEDGTRHIQVKLGKLPLSNFVFCRQSCSKVGQLLVNSSPTPHRGLPCNSPLATPEIDWGCCVCLCNDSGKNPPVLIKHVLTVLVFWCGVLTVPHLPSSIQETQIVSLN